MHYMNYYYMTSDNIFSDWLTSLVTLFDKTLYSMCKKSREVNIIFQSSSIHLKIEMVFPNYLKSSSQSSSGYYFCHRIIRCVLTNYTPTPQRGRGVYCFTSVLLSVCPSVRPRYFSLHFSQ